MMIEKIGKPAMLEQLAEEAAELSQAALKLARGIRNENPTPVTQGEAQKRLIEEWTDVYQCAMELNLTVDWSQIHEKQRRFEQRWEEEKGNLPAEPKESDDFTRGWNAACEALMEKFKGRNENE